MKNMFADMVPEGLKPRAGQRVGGGLCFNLEFYATVSVQLSEIIWYCCTCV